MSDLRRKIADAIAGAVSQDDRYLEHADAVLRVLAEHGGVKNLREQISLMVWRSANERAERAEADLAAAWQQLDQVRKWAEHPLRADLLRELLALLDVPAGHDETGAVMTREHYASLEQLAPGDRIWLDDAWREVGDAVDTGDGEIVVYYIGTTLGKAIERRFTAPAALLVRRAER